MKKILTFLSCTILAILATGTVSADLINYSTDFNSSDGFTEGSTLDEVDGWNGRATQTTVDVGTDGYTELGNGPAFTQRDSGGSWVAGEMVTLTAGVFYDNTSNRSRFRLGLIDLDNDTAGQPKIGFEFDARNGGNIFAFGGGINEDTGLDYTTGQANGETYTVKITKSFIADQFDVDVSFRTYSNSFTVTDATMYSAANVYGHIQQNGGANASVDSYSQTFTAVPEPTSFALIGIGMAGLMIRRRR